MSAIAAPRGVVLITLPTIAFGGARLLRAIFRREPGYLDNPVRQNLWRTRGARQPGGSDRRA
jgi:hypothetical protein